MASAAQADLDHEPLGVGVEGLHLGQPVAVLGGGVEATERDRGPHPLAQRPAGEVAQALALGEGEVEVGIAGEEVAAVEGQRLGQVPLGLLAEPLAGGAEPGQRLDLEAVGVDPDPRRVERVAAARGEDEAAGAAPLALRLELAAQRVDVVAEAVAALARARLGPERLADLVAGDGAPPFADQELEQLAGALAEPVAADRPVGSLDREPSQGGDLEVGRLVGGAAGPGRLGAPATVAGLAGAEVEDDLVAVGGGGGGDPGGALQRAGLDVHADLRQGRGGGAGALRQAAAAEHRLEVVADRLAAGQRRRGRARRGDGHQQLAGAPVDIGEPPIGVGDRDPVGEVLEQASVNPIFPSSARS